MYSIEYIPKAKTALKKLDRAKARLIAGKIQWLAENADNLNHEALQGQWGGAFKLRVGDYRIIYTLNHELNLILIEGVGHRRDVYRK